MPFFYLRTQGFWHAFTMEMTPAQSPESCFVCELHEELFDLLADADFRLKARLLLVSRYFEPRERVALLESLGIGEIRRAESGKRELDNETTRQLTTDLREAEREGLKLNEEA